MLLSGLLVKVEDDAVPPGGLRDIRDGATS
jgi:hypothetical protein